MSPVRKVRPQLTLKEHDELEFYLGIAFEWFEHKEGSKNPDSVRHLTRIKELTRKLEQIELSRSK